MDHDIYTLHHLGIITRNMGDTVARYEQLGFVFTPLSMPEFPLRPGGKPEPVGVANRNAIFRISFLEMLGVVDPAHWASVSAEQRGPFDIDVVLYHVEKPDILVVYREFVARAPRDPAVMAQVERLHAGWRIGIAQALRRGQGDGSIRSDIDPEAMANLVLSSVRGTVSHIFASKEDLEAAARQLRSCLVAEPTKGQP